MSLKKYAYPAFVLFCVCLASVVFLILLNGYTSKIIKSNEKQKADEKRKIVLAAEVYDEYDGYTICLSRDNTVLGYVFVTESEGYGGRLSVMTGIDKNGIITGVLLLSHSESKSLGGEFFTVFQGLDASAVIGENIQGVTGVSVSARAVAFAVNKARDIFNILIAGGESP